MRKKKEWVVVIILGLIIYYLIPVSSIYLNDKSIKIIMFLSLIIINPIYNFMYPFYYSCKRKFNYIIPIVLNLLFVPTAFLIYRDFNVFVYALCYLILGYIGGFIGSCIRSESKFKTNK